VRAWSGEGERERESERFKSCGPNKMVQSVQPVRPVAPTGQTSLAQADRNFAISWFVV